MTPVRRSMMRLVPVMFALVAMGSCTGAAQPPAGLAREALEREDMRWITRSAPELRVHFLADTYAAQHQDSLVARVVAAKKADLALLRQPSYERTLDVFFVETRVQMDTLMGAPVTGFAQMDSAAVFLVTNPSWRAFERHEIMHVLATAAWGRPAAPGDWIQEGLAQFADGHCGGYGVDEVAASLTHADGVVPLGTLFSRFRQLNDLTAYLEAASLVGYIHRTWGLNAVEEAWSQGAAALPSFLGLPVDTLEARWRAALPPLDRSPPPDRLDEVRKHGCG
jgi:hypothetical protein